MCSRIPHPASRVRSYDLHPSTPDPLRPVDRPGGDTGNESRGRAQFSEFAAPLSAFSRGPDRAQTSPRTPRTSAPVRAPALRNGIAVVGRRGSASRRRPSLKIRHPVTRQVAESVEDRTLARSAVLFQRARGKPQPFGGLRRGQKLRCLFHPVLLPSGRPGRNRDMPPAIQYTNPPPGKGRFSRSPKTTPWR